MIFFVVLIGLFFCQSHVDGVVAIVGDRAILKSEVLEQTMLVAQQKNLNFQQSPLLLEQIFSRVLDEKIDRLVVLFYAEQDTLLSVDRKEINQSLDDRISVFIDVFGSKEALEDSMNTTIKDLKSQYWDLVHDEILVEKFRYKNFSDVSISRDAVVRFFQENPDSFPPPPPLGDFSIIQEPVSVSKTTKDSLFGFASSLIKRLNSKELSFDEAARLFSQHTPSANGGGALPPFTRGSFLPEFERVAFSLIEGEVSAPFESKLGLHILKLNQRVGEKIKTQHILFNLTPSLKDKQRVLSLFDKYRLDYFSDPGAFDSLAVTYKKKYKNLSGHYSSFSVNAIPSFLSEKILDIKDYSFSKPFSDGGFIYLIYRHSIKQKEALSLDRDWNIIESFALNHKKYSIFTEWISLKKQGVYIKTFSF